MLNSTFNQTAALQRSRGLRRMLHPQLNLAGREIWVSHRAIFLTCGQLNSLYISPRRSTLTFSRRSYEVTVNQSLLLVDDCLKSNNLLVKLCNLPGSWNWLRVLIVEGIANPALGKLPYCASKSALQHLPCPDHTSTTPRTIKPNTQRTSYLQLWRS